MVILPAESLVKEELSDQLCDKEGDQGCITVDVRGHSLSANDHFQACALDLIRQRSVVQVHLGPSK